VGVPVGSVAIRGAGKTMPAGQPRFRPSQITVWILEPIQMVGMTVEDVEQLRAAVRARLLESVAPARSPARGWPDAKAERPRGGRL
jgi:1-acyl-sn-glycerol-3-phosphate acyltransferase